MGLRMCAGERESVRDCLGVLVCVCMCNTMCVSVCVCVCLCVRVDEFFEPVQRMSQKILTAHTGIFLLKNVQ